MAQLTLTVPQHRIAQVDTADVYYVYIAPPLTLDSSRKRCTFFFITAHMVSGSPVQDTRSNVVTLSGDADWSTYIRRLSGGLEVQEELERSLLQFLIDKHYVGSGVIS